MGGCCGMRCMLWVFTYICEPLVPNQSIVNVAYLEHKEIYEVSIEIYLALFLEKRIERANYGTFIGLRATIYSSACTATVSGKNDSQAKEVECLCPTSVA